MRVEAIKDVTYRGQPRKAGEQFEIDDQDEPLMARSVSPSVKPVEQRQQLPETPKIETQELKAEESEKSRTRRRYMRRDMTPQE